MPDGPYKEKVLELSFETPRLRGRPTVLDDADDVFLMRSDPEITRFTTDASPDVTRADIARRHGFPSCLNFSIELLSTAADVADSSSSSPLTTKNNSTISSSNPPASTKSTATAATTTTTTTRPLPRQVIGMVGGHRLPEIGYMFHTTYQGLGLCTEAVRGFLACYWAAFPSSDPHPHLLKVENFTAKWRRKRKEKKGTDGRRPIIDGHGRERDFLVAITTPGNGRSQAVLRKCGFEFWGDFEEERVVRVGEGEGEEAAGEEGAGGEGKEGGEEKKTWEPIKAFRLWRPGTGP
ncbi:hypothetical protein MMC25_006517 [Agyrium rufum]|nr:hypothetical protein [Agyrium rufum]